MTIKKDKFRLPLAAMLAIADIVTSINNNFVLNRQQYEHKLEKNIYYSLFLRTLLDTDCAI
ncbi:hypothetical protein BpHYR1_051568 [Brachionus plicatilis]|uniref:Uncharacterized protein n=1 Tax=Brachionus plicatilis TaxID=10195 RepID=A0A3M7RM35_BRAPC|nr:hypothetical protein BpHYR1_051568 [Brachionus plicatilis]